MKNEKVKIDPIDEALKLSALPAEKDGLPSSEGLTLFHILSTEYSVKPSEQFANKMIEELYQKLKVDSFGELLTNSLKSSNKTADALAAESGLSLSTIEQLQQDRILANSVPVMQFKNLLKVLQISFAGASQSILKTFELLKSENTISAYSLGSTRFAYRRKSVPVPSSVNVKNSLTESQVLFQNEEALKKYLSRLEQLV
ncbi:MAG TPA: hypothetical protein VIN08_01985 [Ohtaekwangia sp.]|uniref:hypothetical protein n=1 Tax=Ohtaekwangia sp. TaxID=2066019 RepID=UPI002F94E201